MTSATPSYDLAVLGAGPGGYVCAIRAAQLGLNVALVEREPLLGGTCLRVGCIPSKALLESSELYAIAKEKFGEHGVVVGSVGFDLAAMLKRKDNIVSGLAKGIDALIKKNKITRVLGTGRIDAPGRLRIETSAGPTLLEAKSIVLAVGSKPASLPGIVLDGQRVGTSTEALSYAEVPNHLVVIGAGVIGLELGSVWNRLGAHVTVLEYLDHIMPGTDREVSAEALKIFKKQGLEFRLGSRVTGARREGNECVVEVDGVAPLKADRVLVSVGRRPATENVGLELLGIELDRAGRIPVNAHLQTSAPGVYAIGDCVEGPMLAHKAEEEGVAVAEYIATGYGHVNYDAIPSVCYTHPEIGAVGKTEEQLKKDGIPYRKGMFYYRGNGRARALGETDGFAKVLAHAETDRLLGVHMIGARAGELIAEAATAIEFGASAEDLARTCHAHPTLTEIVKEACLAVAGRTIHS